MNIDDLYIGEEKQHEHGNHPDFKFQVEVIVERDEDNIDMGTIEHHALIYTDGFVAITMYEFCYAAWYLNHNELFGGSLWEKGKCKIKQESLNRIKEYIKQ